jgi:hypothetical protein
MLRDHIESTILIGLTCPGVSSSLSPSQKCDVMVGRSEAGLAKQDGKGGPLPALANQL